MGAVLLVQPLVVLDDVLSEEGGVVVVFSAATVVELGLGDGVRVFPEGGAEMLVHQNSMQAGRSQSDL